MEDTKLTVPATAAALGPLATRFDVDIVDECDSTNARLVARAEAGAPSGSVLVARRQTAGRGRLGRIWHSEAGSSLTFSLLWRPPTGRSVDGLSLAIGVAVAEALAESGFAVALKWPNDILFAGGKLGGVLIELAGGAAVIGIGLNLHSPRTMPAELRSTAAALDRAVDANRLLASVLASLHAVLAEFSIGGFAVLRERWSARNAHLGERVQVASGVAPAVVGRCVGVADDGALLLQIAGNIERVISGDVSLRPA